MMLHRHLNPGFEDSIEAVQDTLERGSEQDWRELATRVVSNPEGQAAQSLLVVLDKVYIYGTTRLWRAVMKDLGVIRDRT